VFKERELVKTKGAKEWQQEECLHDSVIETIKQLQHSGAKKQHAIINEGSLYNNWAGLPDNSTTIQSVVNNQTGEVNQQLVISEQVTTEKTLKEIIRNINKQVLETKYTLNLGQLLWVILDIKCYIFNSVPSKPTLPELIVTSVTIDHQMAVI
jgi:hypothetical protein